ncbi:MAG: hypothetical protein IJV22_04650 [Bacteroidales bacterium]|nr:hypothetical protein [Bacteroidales bacterium]
MAKNDIVKAGEATRFRSGEEQAKIAAKGGRASGRKRREKRQFKELLEIALSTEVTNKTTGERTSRKDVAMIRLADRCASGDLKAISLAAELLGEKVMKQEHSGEVKAEVVDNRTPEEIKANIERLGKLYNMINEDMGK